MEKVRYFAQNMWWCLDFQQLSLRDNFYFLSLLGYKASEVSCNSIPLQVHKYLFFNDQSFCSSWEYHVDSLESQKLILLLQVL